MIKKAGHCASFFIKGGVIMLARIEEVLNKIISLLEKGELPWKKGWITQKPYNPISKYEYTGFNRWYLSYITEEQGYSINKWATFKQIKEKGGIVKKGAKSQPIIFFTLIQKEIKPEDNKEEPEIKVFPYVRYYNVFNLEDTTLFEEYKDTQNNDKPIERCEEFIHRINPVIKHGGDKAYYNITKDEIHLPLFENFVDAAAYYSTLFHELAHWTGHKSRLDRFQGHVEFGSLEYAKEELIAEFTNAFLCTEFSMENKQIQNSAAYIQSWLEVLKRDKRNLVYASSKAEQAYRFLLAEAGMLNAENKEVA